jgi:hypothetical protein
MTWTLVPDSMTKITDSVTSSVINVANTASTATTSSLKTSEIDIQIGPAHF